MFRTKLSRIGVLAIVVAVYGCVADDASRSTMDSETTSNSKGQTGPYDASAIIKTIETEMQRCSNTYGYYPRDVEESATGLLEGELQWRQCVYDAIETKAIPRTKVPDRYRELIREDRAMTRSIREGTLTRDMRSERLKEIIAGIKAAEAEAVAASDPATQAAQAEEDMERLRDVLSTVRR